MSFKVLKSDEEHVWLFNATISEDIINAGLACFAPHCPSEVKLNIKDVQRTVIIPSRAMGSAVPLRMLNARLSLLPLISDEQIL
jgi:hypothetical protein